MDSARETPLSPKNAQVKLFYNVEKKFSSNVVSLATCAFSPCGVQNVIPNGCWIETVITPKKPSSQETNYKFLALYGCHELMPWLIYMAFIWQLCFLAI